MSRSYIIYINREGRHSIFCWVYVYQTPPKKKKRKKSTTCEHRAAGSLQVTAHVFWSRECTNPRSQTLESCRPAPSRLQMWRYDVPDADSSSEAGGVFHITPVFIRLWYDRETNCTYFSLFMSFFFFPCMFSTAATTADWSERIMSCLF